MKSGTESKKVMIVLASNQPEQLDWAINDRIGRHVEFPLPGKEERLRLIELYYRQNILEGACLQQKSIAGKGRNFTPDENLLTNQDAIFEKVAERTEGMSGRGLNRMVTAWEHSLYQSVDGVLTEDHVNAGVDKYLDEMTRKNVFVTSKSD